MSNRLKIAIVLPSYLPVPDVLGGAIETTIQALININEEHKYASLHLISAYNKKAKKLSRQYKYSFFHWVNYGFVYNFLNLFVRVLRKLLFHKLSHLDIFIIKRILLKQNFDKIIVHGNTRHLKSISSYIGKEKIFFSVHANIFNEESNENRQFGKMAVKYFCASNFIKNNLIRYCEIHPSNIEVIRNTISEKYYSLSDKDMQVQMNKECNLSVDIVKLLFVGRLVPKKGIKELLSSLSSIDVDFKLIIIGSNGSGFGKMEAYNQFDFEVNRMINDLGDKVVKLGFVHNNYLKDYYSIADIIVMPTLYEEAASKVIMEAMACGKPVITTNKGANSEYLPCEAGILLNADKDFEKQLSIAIEKLILNKNIRTNMGVIAKEYASDFHPKRYFKEYFSNLILNSDI